MTIYFLLYSHQYQDTCSVVCLWFWLLSSCSRPVNVVGWKRAICLEFMEKVRYFCSTFHLLCPLWYAMSLFNVFYHFVIDMLCKVLLNLGWYLTNLLNVLVGFLNAYIISKSRVYLWTKLLIVCFLVQCVIGTWFVPQAWWSVWTYKDTDTYTDLSNNFWLSLSFFLDKHWNVVIMF